MFILSPTPILVAYLPDSPSGDLLQRLPTGPESRSERVRLLRGRM